MLENYQTKLEKNQIHPTADQSPQRPAMLSLDAMKLPGRAELRERAQQEIEKDYLRLPPNTDREFLSEINFKNHKDERPGDFDRQLDPQPGTRTMVRDLTIFSHSDSLSVVEKKKPKRLENWSVPFQINKPVFPDIDLEKDLKYRNRDPRKDIKYFSIDESSSLASKDLTRLQFRRPDQDPKQPSTFAKQGQRIMASNYGSSASTQHLLPSKSEGPVRLPGDDREEMIRKIMEGANRQFDMPTGALKRVDDIYTNLLKSSKL